MDKKEDDETSYSMEGISFGLADGVICCLGLTIGVAEATSNASSRACVSYWVAVEVC